MTDKERFIDAHGHYFEGCILDAAMSHDRKGGELSIWLKHMRWRIREQLGKIYDEFKPAAPAAQPGVKK